MNRTKSATPSAPNIGVSIRAPRAATARQDVSKCSCAAISRRRPSSNVAAPCDGFIALVVLPLGKTPRLRMRRNTTRSNGWRMRGMEGNADGRPAATSADASYERATCSTIWLGDHLPEAQGSSQGRPHAAALVIRASAAFLLAIKAASTGSTGPSGFNCDPLPRPAGRHRGVEYAAGQFR
jgi:hypothetical protein